MRWCFPEIYKHTCEQSDRWTMLSACDTCLNLIYTTIKGTRDWTTWSNLLTKWTMNFMRKIAKCTFRIFLSSCIIECLHAMEKGWIVESVHSMKNIFNSMQWLILRVNIFCLKFTCLKQEDAFHDGYCKRTTTKMHWNTHF